MSLTKNEWAEWKSHPVTEKVLGIVQTELDNHIASVMSGSIIADTADQTAMNATRSTGRIEGLSFIASLEEFVIDGDDDGE